MKKAVLKSGRERSVLRKHPWIFSGAIAQEPPGAEPGETVEVATAGGETLGFGSWSPSSQIRVRMLSFDAARPPRDGFVRDLVFASVARRSNFFVEGYTDAVRLVNAESDLLPGVVADSYAGWIVCQFTSAGAEAMKEEVAQALMASVPGAKGVAERRDAEARVREGLDDGEGAVATHIDAGERGGLESGAFVVLAGEEPPEKIEITEGPVKFLVDVRRGHKTGFYLDQRDARAAVGRYANGADVLNCFSYTGGFGLFARACGAASVVQVDASGAALEAARENEALQHLCGTKMEYVEADVFKYLRKCRDANKTFDMIVLDPPKFAETKAQVMRAARGYKDINLLAMKLLRPGGILATFSCSGAIDDALFAKIVAEAATDAGRRFQSIARTGQPPDHPVLVSFPEGRYLKGEILRLV